MISDKVQKLMNYSNGDAWRIGGGSCPRESRPVNLLVVKKSQTTLVVPRRPLDLELKLVSAACGTIMMDEGDVGAAFGCAEPTNKLRWC
jgi:hypothetical protein